MFISKAAAQEIVEEIGREIQSPINLMDANGFIIASTDSKRIGQLHSGALRIIREKLSGLVITREMETSTMKMGINLPLLVYNELVGVIGITGSPEEISGYGNIVKHMTEIMIADSSRNSSKRYGHRVYYRFLEEWIEASAIPVYENHFVEHGLHLGIDITKPYRILSLSFLDYKELSYSLEGQELLENMESSIRRRAEQAFHIYLRKPPYQLLFLPECDNRHLEAIAKELINAVKKEFQQVLIAGYDSSYSSHRNMKQAAAESEAAVRYAATSSHSIVSYDTLGLHFLVQQIPTPAKLEFTTKFIYRIPEEKRPEYYQLVNAYFKYNGSLQKMSEALYLHKNTLQYKLRKLWEYTDLDIRDIRSSAAYFMFLSIYQELQNN